MGKLEITKVMLEEVKLRRSDIFAKVSICFSPPHVHDISRM